MPRPISGASGSNLKKTASRAAIRQRTIHVIHKTMKKTITSLLLLAGLGATAQVKIGDNPTTVNASAVLEMESSNKGLLLPRMTTLQRNAIASAATGLTIYNTDTKALEVNTGTPLSPVWSSARAGDVTSTTLVSSTSPAGTSVGQMMYNTGAVQPTGLVYWDGTQWKSVASSGGDTTNNFPVTNNSTVTNNNPVTNNSTSTFNGVSTFNDQAVFNDTAVFNGGMKVGNLPQGAVTDSLMVFEPNTKEVRRLSIAGAAAAGEPWYKVGTTAGATANTDDVYLNGAVGVGTATPIGKLDVTGNLVLRNSSVDGGQQNISIRDSFGTNRWSMGMGVAEPGSGNAGGNFYLWNYADDGSFLGNPLIVERSTGNVGINNGAPSASAILDVASTSKGFLPPRMTSTDRDAIIQPAKGLMIFNTTTNAQETNTGTPASPVWSSAATVSAAGEPWYKVGTTAGATANTDSVYLNGNVGIGTNNPQQTLDVAGTFALRMSAIPGGTQNMQIQNSAGANRWSLGMATTEPGSGNDGADFKLWGYADDGSYLNNPLTVTRATGNVGIGTATPLSKLDVAGNLIVRGSSMNGGNKNISIKNDAGIDRWAMGMGVAEPGSGNAGGNFYLWNYGDDGTLLGNPFIVNRATGNVGIGTGTPAEKLDVNGNVNVNGKIVLPLSDGIKINLMGSDNSARIAHENGWTVANYAAQQGVVSSGQFSWNNTDAAGNYIERMRISNTGRIYMNTGDHGARLNIGGAVASTATSYDPLVTFAATDGAVGTIYHSNNGSKPYIGLQSFVAGDGEKTPFVIGEWGGQLGIGTNNPVAKLHVNGDAYFTNLNTNAGFRINANANRTYLQYDGTAGSNTALVLSGRGSGNEDITINGATGYVGINNNAPKAPLHIGGTGASSFSTGQIAFFHSGFASGAGLAVTASTGPRSDASLIAEGNIWSKASIVSAASMTFSDKRIKNIIGQSDAGKDLDLLNKIRITDYRMKDVVMQGNKQYKKVIAQEVEAIYPEAVTQQTGFVPNIYQLADNVQNMGNNTYKVSFKNKVEYNNNVTGDLKLYDEQKEITAKVVSKGDNEIVFTTTEAINANKLFLFGEEVTDFRAVDYEALSTLNISATQELYREVQALKKQNALLTAKVEDTKKLETAYNELAAQVKAMQEVLKMPAVKEETVATVNR
jgi:hypothetical protein